ncbi:single-stranded-DNA-specific exonuclease RecJ [Candidatus Peregrinibacteria bacterium]|nr:single-stranded-DNA-specific exonuclease RecJ [Candidatus Peregrinibacteria bacterium]
MSLIGKKWVIQNQDADLGIIAKLHKNRGLDTEEKKKSFFEDGLSSLHDPYLMKGMDISVDRIKKAVERNEKIMIFGDYDVDGITSTVILYDFLKRIGADVYYEIPNRENDGYGLKDYFIERFKEDGVNLLITVDCGVANATEVNLAQNLGIDTIITDHHDIPNELPPAYSIINPKQEDCNYPNKDLSGSGVAYKLVSALAPYYFDGDLASEYLLKQLGIATLGLVADCMPLTGENRTLTKIGLKSLEEGKNPGITALLESAGVSNDKITSTTIGFYIGPRINAAGRLDTAKHAFELLLGDIEKVSTLSTLNIKRQKIVKEFVENAVSQVSSSDGLPNIVIVENTKWHVGTLGLVAGKICDIFNRPAIAMQERESEYIASCRSLNDFDITSFLRKVAGDLFSAFGGHKLAGGFTLPKHNYEEFIKRVNEAGKNAFDSNDFQSTLEIDCEISSDELCYEISGHINKMEPFGNGNPEPTLVLKNTKILNIKPVGKTGEHLQFPVKYGDQQIQAIAFRFGEHLDKIDQTKEYDIAFNLEVNEWKGYKKLQMRVVDLKQSNTN